jgi:hypothetical protein
MNRGRHLVALSARSHSETGPSSTDGRAFGLCFVTWVDGCWLLIETVVEGLIPHPQLAGAYSREVRSITGTTRDRGDQPLVD